VHVPNKWMASCGLLISLLGSPLAYGRAPEIKVQVAGPSVDKKTAQTTNPVSAVLFAFGEKNHRFTDFGIIVGENRVFDIFCSAAEESLSNVRLSSAPPSQRHRVFDSALTGPSRQRNQFSPC
jgi:hypothetical protein